MTQDPEKNSEKKFDRRKFLGGSALLGAAAAFSTLPGSKAIAENIPEGKKSILMDNSLCIECQACRVACQNENEIEEEYSFIKFNSLEKGEYPDVDYYLSRHSCMHCPDSPCIDHCPVDALYKGHGEFTTLKVEDCIACGQCLEICPFDVPEIGEERMYKCDACQHLLEEGKEPACVNTCIAYALDFGDFDVMLEKGQERVEELKGDYPYAGLYADYNFGLLLILTAPPEDLDLV